MFKALFLFFFILTTSHAKELIFKSSTDIDWTALDQSGSHQLLIKLKNGGSVVLDLDTKAASETFTGSCKMASSMWNKPVFVHPYVVNLDTSCVLHENTRTLDSLSSNTAPQDAFSTSYLGMDDTYFYFVINSRPWNPPGPHGFLHMKAVNHRQGGVSVAMIADKVPGFSGAMILDGDRFLYTQSLGPANHLHAIVPQTLIDAFHSRSALSFPEITTPVASNFRGMSLWMSAGRDAYLYGEEKTAYAIDRRTLQKTVLKIEPTCQALGFVGEKILISCQDNGIYFQ